MPEAQYLSLILGLVATIATVLIALLIHNSRLTDTKEALRGEMKGESATLRAEMAAMRETLLSQMATYQLDIISKIAELDNRITRLER